MQPLYTPRQMRIVYFFICLAIALVAVLDNPATY
jgi:hypothetical protein